MSQSDNFHLVNPFTHAPVYRAPDGPAAAGQQDASFLSTAPSIVHSSGTPTDEQFADIRSRFGDPRANVRPEDYYVFRLIAAGDGLDSYFTRQDVETSFRNMANDLTKGQSVLGSHQMATFSYGSSFVGEVVPAEIDRAEYEPTFYPQWDTPSLRTANWLVGDYFIPRGLTLNGQSSDDLIRSLEMGNVRKVSVSFMVGQYVCGLDGRELIPSMFGPMPDEECSHFPGVIYDGQPAWALMKNNTLVETSLVYKNASPSSMLLRKAESMAERGLISTRDVERLEQRFHVRLPRFERTLWSTNNGTTNTTSTAGLNVATQSPVVTVSSWTTEATPIEQEESDMTDRRRRASDDATREMVRAALASESEPEEETEASTDAVPADEAATAEVSESTDDAETREADPATTEGGTDEAPAPADAAAESTDAEDEGEEADAGDDEAAEATSESPDSSTEHEPDVATVSEAAGEAEKRHRGHTHGGDDKGGHSRKKVEPEAAVETEADDTTAEAEADPISEFAAAADRLASALTRNPDAFDVASLSEAARAERTVDLALIDAGCDTTVGARVARTFETRSRAMREALGDQLTVEAIRTLKARADLGETLYEDLVKDAVAARTSVQGEDFNAEKYRDLLLSARDVAFVKEETASWKKEKSNKFTAGRSVTPRAPIDARPRAEDRKSLPEAPINVSASKSSAPSTNIFDKRTK
jgi:hypothetical protein